jgi:hypothetical protein
MTEIGANKDSTSQREAIQSAIQRRMELQGYRFNARRPDLLVSYKMFYGDFDFYGYNQPDFENWLVYENDEEAYDPCQLQHVRGDNYRDTCGIAKSVGWFGRDMPPRCLEIRTKMRNTLNGR